MLIGFGIWCAIAGCVALLAGVTSRRRAGRLRRHGVATWATVIAAARDGDPGATTVQYSLPDGRVAEHRCPAAIRPVRALLPGERVQVWYDPADPREVLVSGRDGRCGDSAFAVAGVLLVLAGVWIAGH